MSSEFDKIDQALDIEATPVDLIVPEYLARYQPGGRFAIN